MPLSRTPTVLVGALDRCQEARVLILALILVQVWPGAGHFTTLSDLDLLIKDVDSTT